MSTRREGPVKLQGRYSDSLHYYFSITQTDNRFALCKECLCYDLKVKIKFKGIYSSMKDMELCSMPEYDFTEQLTERYSRLNEVAYGGEFARYDKGHCPEGALFPFVRLKGSKKFEFIDTGCIWIGSKFSYPLIFVDNDVAHWISPYSVSGYVRQEPFLPFAQVVKIIPKLMNKNIYPDLEIDSLI